MASTIENDARKVGRDLFGGTEPVTEQGVVATWEPGVPEHQVDTLRAVAYGRRLQAQAMGRAVKHGIVSLKSALAGIAAVWRRSRDESHAVHELRGLDDRMLRDIGIAHRSQIASAVHSMGSDSHAAAASAAAPHVVSLDRQSEPKRKRDDATKAA